MVVAGPNGQGVISTAESMCAQIVAPYPPAGRIGVASQSGNLVSSFLHYACLTGIGVSKAISAGNSAQLGVPDYLEYFAADPETAVALALPRGRARRARAPARARARDGGEARRAREGRGRGRGPARGGEPHGLPRERRPRVRRPLPPARRAARADRRAGLRVGGELRDAAAPARPAHGRLHDRGRLGRPRRRRLRRRRPRARRAARTTSAARSTASCRRAGAGATRSTSPAARPATRSRRCSTSSARTRASTRSIHLGLGIQAAQAQAFRSGPFHPGHGLDRIVEFHERQDRRYAAAAREASERHGKPVLSATELVYADRAYGNAGPVGVREEGRALLPERPPRGRRRCARSCDYAEFRATRRG